MSAETRAAMERAIETHITAEVEASAIVTGFVLHAAYISTDTDSRGSTGYFREWAEGQPYHVGLGLAVQLVDQYSNAFGDDNDE